MVIETALDEEMSEHLGYDKHAAAGRDRGNSRNGKRSKTVLPDAADEVQIEVAPDRDGTLEAAIVKKRQRCLALRNRMSQPPPDVWAEGTIELYPYRIPRRPPRHPAWWECY